MKRLLSLLFVSLGLLLFGVAESKVLIVAHPTAAWGTVLPIVVAQERGLFAAEGMEVKSVVIRGGPTVMAALISGNIDYAIVAGIPAVRAIASGGPVVIVGNHKAFVDYLLVGIKGMTSLGSVKGKIVGVTGAGGIAEFATVEALARKGLTRDKDYTILYAGNGPTRVDAMERGRIHASPFSASDSVELEQKGFSILLNVGQLLPELPQTVVVTTRQKADNNPREIQSFLRALKRSTDLIRSEKEKLITPRLINNLYGKPHIERKALEYTAEGYSVVITRENIEALISSAKLEAEAKKMGGPEKFVLDLDTMRR